VFRKIEFYETDSGRCPVIEFIDSATRRDEKAKIMVVFENVQTLEIVPSQFLKKLQTPDKIWEIRVLRYRFLGFYDPIDTRRLVLVHAFAKQTQKTPLHEIEVAAKRKSMYCSRGRTV
jgi:hypothetical protein